MFFSPENSKKPHRKKFLYFLLLSLFFIHLPAAIIVWRIFDESLTTVRSDKIRKENPPVMVDLKNSRPPRLADIDKPQVEAIPDNPSAVGKYNSKVSQETVSATSRPSQGQSSPQSSVASPPKKPQIKPVQSKQETKSETKTVQIKPDSSLSPPTLQHDLNKLRLQRENNLKKNEKELFGSPPPTPFQGTLPNREASQGGDYFPDYKVGSKTYLNVLARPNVFYFVEMKRKFRAAFNPAPVLRPYVGKLPKGGLSVVWGYSINKDGKLSQPMLLRSSGLPGYDQEAKRTILASQPFTNPPAELLDASDTLNIAWTFIVTY